MRAVWITWEKQRRNKSMAAAVGASLHELEYKGNALARYWVLGRKTVRIVRQAQPDVIFFQNPSLVLAALVTLLKVLSITRARTVGDFHNAGVYPPVAQFLVPWMVRNSDLTIVSNRNLESAITAFGGKAIAIPDPIPHMDEAHIRNPSAGSSRFDVFFICSWAPDEPIANVLHAAQILENDHADIVIAITGRPKLERAGWEGPVPRNVNLTGFLSDHEFEQRLASSSAVLDLTTRPDCMVCGAYEAVSAQVPMIVSDNGPTRAYFHKGALYTDNSAQSIAQLILEMKDRHPQLSAEIIELKRELLETEKAALQSLKQLTVT